MKTFYLVGSALCTVLLLILSSCVSDQRSSPSINNAIHDSLCSDLCGDGVCNQQNCTGPNCPCPESPLTCAQDCVQNPSEYLLNKSLIACDKDADCAPLPTLCTPQYCINEEYLHEDRMPQPCPGKVDLLAKKTGVCACEDNLCILQKKYELTEGK